MLFGLQMVFYVFLLFCLWCFFMPRRTISLFLFATKRLYKRVCPLVRRSVGPSVTLLQKPSYIDAEGASSCPARLVSLVVGRQIHNKDKVKK